MDKTAFVTGASAGIGEATARALLAAGYRVFAGARRLDRMAGLAAAGATLLKLDLTDDASISMQNRLQFPVSHRVILLVNSTSVISQIPRNELNLRICLAILQHFCISRVATKQIVRDFDCEIFELFLVQTGTSRVDARSTRRKGMRFACWRHERRGS
jgi:NAD(P)-dependent dehydrogenase (short-subunit alcohol dehydrogenase family)